MSCVNASLHRRHRRYGSIVSIVCDCLQLFDAAIIVTSFTLDLIFVEGITGVQGEETLAFIIIFLLWRVLRVINGNNMHNMQQHCPNLSGNRPRRYPCRVAGQFMAAARSRSTVFARWYQCAYPSDTRFLWHTPLTTTNGSTIGSAICLHSRCQILPIRYTV